MYYLFWVLVECGRDPPEPAPGTAQDDRARSRDPGVVETMPCRPMSSLANFRASPGFVGWKQLFLRTPTHAPNKVREGARFVELEISNGTLSAVFNTLPGDFRPLRIPPWVSPRLAAASLPRFSLQGSSKGWSFGGVPRSRRDSPLRQRCWPVAGPKTWEVLSGGTGRILGRLTFLQRRSQASLRRRERSEPLLTLCAMRRSPRFVTGLLAISLSLSLYIYIYIYI